MPKINKSFVERTNEAGVYRDSELKGFCLRVSPKGKKTYFIDAKPRGSRDGITYRIGVHGITSAENARAEAKDLLAQTAKGINPNETKRLALEQAVLDRKARDAQEALESLTLGTLLTQYLASKKLKPSTVYNYRCVVNSKLGDWLNKPIVSINADMIENRHKQISDKHRGEADNVMRVLRALFTFAAYKYENEKGEPIISANPVRRLSQNNQWNNPARRQGVIKAHDLADWYRAVCELENTGVRDYLILLLFTGLRKAEAESLTWGERGVDLKSRTLFVQETKNHEPLLLPIPNFLHGILLQRWQSRESNEWVFPGENKSGHLSDPRYSIEKVKQACGVSFTPHDLRRTFITIADGLGIGQYTIKKLVNHKNAGDVTAGYFAAEVERLREPMEKVCAFICERAGMKVKKQTTRSNRTKVIPLNKAR